MSALCLKIIKVIKMIVLWSNDLDENHTDRKVWANNGLLVVRSTGGFAKLLRFGIDTDYVYMCHKLVLVQDKSARDISLHDWECERYLHITKSLMEEGRIFEPDCQGTFPWAILSAVRNEPLCFFLVQIQHLGQQFLNKHSIMPRICTMSLALTCRTRSRTIAIGKPCGHSTAVVHPSQKQ